MPYNRNQIPDAPLPVSMMPRVDVEFHVWGTSDARY